MTKKNNEMNVILFAPVELGSLRITIGYVQYFYILMIVLFDLEKWE